MAHFATNIKKLALAAVLGASSLAQAGTIHTLDFNQPVDSPFMYGDQITQFGNYMVESVAGSQNGGLAGMIIDGADSGACFGAISCPVNNPTPYYAGLDDGYFAFGNVDGLTFKIKSLNASFIGIPEAAFGKLSVLGFDANWQNTGAILLNLAGPNLQGQYNFGHFDLGAFGDLEFAHVLIVGYGCDSSSCNRVSNLGNFGVDDIVTETIPEPASLALIGLGLLGMGAMRRRRAA